MHLRAHVVALVAALFTTTHSSPVPRDDISLQSDCSKLIQLSHSTHFNFSSSSSEALQLATCLLSPSPPLDTCTFYTRGSKPTALRYATYANKTTIYDAYDPKYFDENVDPMKQWKKDGKQRSVFRVTSKAYALKCAGNATVVMPVGQEACPRSIWITDEYEVIRAGESGIRLPVMRVGWVEGRSKGGEEGKWDMRELTERPQKEKRGMDRFSVESGQSQLGALSRSWSSGVDLVEDDPWALVHGRCQSSQP